MADQAGANAPAQADPDTAPDLWKKAYRNLYDENPKLVTAYLNIVLKDQAGDPSSDGNDNGTGRGLAQADAAEVDAYLKLDKDQVCSFLAAKVEGAHSAQIRFKVREKEVVIDIQEQVDRIVKGIICAKDFIGATLSNEPHAALAWAGVCVVLPFVLNAHEQSSAALNGFEYITNLMLQYLVREQTYRGADADSIDSSGGDNAAKLKEQFESKTVKLYTRILEYQIRLARQYTRHRFFRYMRNLAAVDGWPGKLEEIKNFETQGTGDLAVIDAMRLKFIALEQKRSFDELSKRLDTNQKEMVAVVKKMEAQAIEARNKKKEEDQLKAREEALQKAFRTIVNKPHEIPKPLDYRRKVENRKGKVLDGTCDWVYGDSEFEKFVHSDQHDLIWIHGNPGKGKSMLSLSLIDNISVTVASSSNNASKATVSYYFFAHDDYRLKPAVSMMRLLLFQLIENRPDLVSYILQDLDIKGDELFVQPEALQISWRILMDMIRASPPSESSYFIIDALDECDVDSRSEWLQHLVEALNLEGQEKSSQKQQHKMKWIITSRSTEFDIREAIGENKFKNICLEDHADEIEKNVLSYIDAQMATFTNRYLEKEKTAIRTTLLENCEGTFLWVWLACEQIRKTRPGLVAAVLKKPVKGLDAFYQRMLESIEEDAQDMTKDILQVVLHAQRPLSLRELATASNVVTEVDDNTPNAMVAYLELCGSLLIIEQATSIVTLVHKSARAFLMQSIKTEPYKSLYAASFAENEGHLILTERCYHYLHSGALATFATEYSTVSGISTAVDKVATAYPFIDYATAYWTLHARKASSKSNESRMQDIFIQDMEFLEPGESVIRGAWGRISEFGAWWGQYYSALHVACRGGIPPLVSYLLGRGDDIDQPDRRGWTPLHHATWNGHEDVVALLIEKGAKTDAKDEKGRNVLHFAAQHGYESITRLLCRVENSATLLNDADKKKKSPMHLAVEEVHEAIVRVLAPLMAASSIDPRDEDGYTPLHYAACWAHVERWLHRAKYRGGGVSVGSVSRISTSSMLKIQHAKDDNTKDERFFDPIIRILLDHGARVEAVDSFGQTPLHLAVFAEKLSAISLLSKHGKCDLSPRNSADFTPLMWATDNSLFEVAKLLLELGADPLVATDDNRTPLLFAAYEKNAEMIQLLLRFNADPCSRIESGDENGGSPLYVSCQHGPFEAAKLLIDKATDLNITFRGSGDTPLLISLNWTKHHKISEALIAAGADIFQSNNDNLTPLHAAAWNGGESLTKLLLSLGTDINLRTIQAGLTPFMCAVSSKCYPVAQLLANAGSDLHLTDPRGGTMLHLAAYFGPPETIQLLLDAGLDPNVVDNHGATPLHDAVASGSVALVKMLIDAGADLTAVCEEYGGTALEVAIKRKNWQVVQYLQGLASTSLPDRTATTAEENKEAS